MGVRNYWIDGVSGVGKTAVAEELERRGYHVIHGDRVLGYVGDPASGQALKRPVHESDEEAVTWLHQHWIWPVDIVKYLIASQAFSISFFCGGARNSHLFTSFFDQVFVLEVDHTTLMKRLAQRPFHEFGGRLVEQKLIARLHATHGYMPKNATAIDASPPVQHVVDNIIVKCGIPDTALSKALLP